MRVLIYKRIQYTIYTCLYHGTSLPIKLHTHKLSTHVFIYLFTLVRNHFQYTRVLIYFYRKFFNFRKQRFPEAKSVMSMCIVSTLMYEKYFLFTANWFFLSAVTDVIPAFTLPNDKIRRDSRRGNKHSKPILNSEPPVDGMV